MEGTDILRHEVPPEFIRWARQIGPPNPVICDIGSRDAMDGIYLCKTLKGTECHIFEPNPAAVGVCVDNIAWYGGGCNIFFNPVALSDRIGPVEFFPVNRERSDNKDIGFSSMLRINPAYASQRRGSLIQDKITVPAITLDSYFEKRRRQPDVLWVDVEGTERLVFSGGERSLSHVKLIHLEVSFRPMQIGRPLFWEIDELLTERRFTLLKFVGVSRAKAALVVRKLLPNLPWRWNAIYCRGEDRVPALPPEPSDHCVRSRRRRSRDRLVRITS